MGKRTGVPGLSGRWEQATRSVVSRSRSETPCLQERKGGEGVGTVALAPRR